MRISPLPTKATTSFLLAASSGRFGSVPSNDSGETSGKNIAQSIEREETQLFRFPEESAGSVETRSSPPKGDGVFATQTIPKGTFVCRYEGELLTNDEQEERYPFDDDWPEYCLRISSDLCTDGVNSCHWSRYVNHNEEPNLVVKIHGLDEYKIEHKNEIENEEPFAYFESIRAIDIGEELSFDYGPVYFHVRGIVPAQGTESRTVKSYSEEVSNDEKEEDEREDKAWKQLGLPEVPATVEDIQMITTAATRRPGGGGPWVSNRRKKAAFVRALDYFGAVEWIDGDSFFVIIERKPEKGATAKTLVVYPSIGENELASILEDVIRKVSAKKQ